MSDSSLAPNFPICPCNFKPVKVLAMVQNLIDKNIYTWLGSAKIYIDFTESSFFKKNYM